jgi:hypothetical protein
MYRLQIVINSQSKMLLKMQLLMFFVILIANLVHRSLD